MYLIYTPLTWRRVISCAPTIRMTNSTVVDHVDDSLGRVRSPRQRHVFHCQFDEACDGQCPSAFLRVTEAKYRQGRWKWHVRAPVGLNGAQHEGEKLVPIRARPHREGVTAAGL